MGKRVYPPRFSLPPFSPGIGQTAGYGGRTKWDDEDPAFFRDKFGSQNIHNANNGTQTSWTEESFGIQVNALANNGAETSWSNTTTWGNHSQG